MPNAPTYQYDTNMTGPPGVRIRFDTDASSGIPAAIFNADGYPIDQSSASQELRTDVAGGIPRVFGNAATVYVRQLGSYPGGAPGAVLATINGSANTVMAPSDRDTPAELAQLLTSYATPGNTIWLQQIAADFGFTFTAITAVDAATGLPTAATVRWPDGTAGAFTGTTDGVNGYTGYVVTWAGGTTKTVTASGITYDAATGLPLGPTSLAVA